MAIRNYWISTPKYSKPILSRRPARHKAGFHGYYLPHQADVDGDLKLVHLKEFDRTICMERELYKFNLAKQSHQSEIDKAFNIHIHQYEQNLKRGKVCQFALGCYATKYDKVFDNTGTIALEKIPEKFKLLPV